MKTQKIIYWGTTSVVSAMMVFSAYSYFTNPEMASHFIRMGFQDYFRVELGVAKIIGAVVLLIPQIPAKVKEWAYAGFGIVFISAALAHYNAGDGPSGYVAPLVFLGILIVSNFYFSKISKA